MQNSRITVVIPAYNCCRHLEACLEGLERSSLQEFECIVVDDGSTDDSMDVARRYAVTVISPGGRAGPAHARNLGAKAATGEILYFIDADVCVYPDTLARVSAAFSRDTELTALIGSYGDSPDSPDFLSQYKNLMHHYVHQTAREQASTFWSGCSAIRRSVFGQFSGFDARRYQRPAIEDIELGYRLFSAGYKMVLDRSLVVKHLKKWSFWGLVKTDILDRGVPWTELILRDRHIPNDLNVQLSQRVSVALVFLLVVSSALVAIYWRGYFLTPQFSAVLLSLGRYWADAAVERNLWAIAAVTAGMLSIIALSYVYHMLGHRLCFEENSNDQLKLDFYFRLFKPLPPSEKAEHSAPSATIVNLMTDRKRFESDIRLKFSKCTMRDQIPGNFTPAEIMVFRRESKVAERAIRFPETFAEIEAIGKARSRNGCACDLPPAPLPLEDGNRSESK
jgi:GT2 family glycosyltransferase